MLEKYGNSIISCQSCQSKNIVNFLSLGKLPIANDLYSVKLKKIDQIFYPLDLFICENFFSKVLVYID